MFTLIAYKHGSTEPFIRVMFSSNHPKLTENYPSTLIMTSVMPCENLHWGMYSSVVQSFLSCFDLKTVFLNAI